jgi:hypothetical protein
MEILYLSLAYKYVMLTLMLAEVNYAVGKLEIPNWQPITFAQVETYNVSAPRMRAGGSLDTTNGVFGFGENKLQFMQWPEPNADLPLRERQMHWSRLPSLVDTNGAYQLATNWLSRLEVDVAALGKKHPVSVLQQFFYPNGDGNQQPILLPRFEVRWGKNPSAPAVWVSIFGPTKTPLFIRQEDGSFIRRPEVVKPEAIEMLLSVTNADFGGWTMTQKSNLVVQSAGNVYSRLVFPDVIREGKHLENKQSKSVTVPKPTIDSVKKTRTLPATKRQ